MTKEFFFDWTKTFQDLVYQTGLRGNDDREFKTCLKCLEVDMPDFDKKDMVDQSKPFKITIKFEACKKHGGDTSYDK